jgi:translation initiation factor 1
MPHAEDRGVRTNVVLIAIQIPVNVSSWAARSNGCYAPPMGLFDGTKLEQPVTCEHCSQAIGLCKCPRDKQGKVLLPSQQQARVRCEQRSGKFVTVFANVEKGPNAKTPGLEDLLKLAKNKFATGGTINKSGEIELQGDHRDKAVAWLVSLGYPAKAAGG